MVGGGGGVQCFGGKWRAKSAAALPARTDRSRCAALLYYLLPKIWRRGAAPGRRPLPATPRKQLSQNAARETGPLITCEAKPPAPGPLTTRAFLMPSVRAVFSRLAPRALHVCNNK